jgi:hypothetical protein
VIASINDSIETRKQACLLAKDWIRACPDQWLKYANEQGYTEPKMKQAAQANCAAIGADQA